VAQAFLMSSGSRPGGAYSLSDFMTTQELDQLTIQCAYLYSPMEKIIPFKLFFKITTPGTLKPAHA